jgi:hypothetical protein
VATKLPLSLCGSEQIVMHSCQPRGFYTLLSNSICVPVSYRKPKPTEVTTSKSR